jgi:hypothetical protein
MKFLNLKKRRGIATVITSAIMMSAVAIIGSAGLVWSQTALTTQQVEMSNVIDDYTNKINESLTFEYVYCNDTPCETIIVIITNNGKIAMNIAQINISDKISSFNKIHSLSNGEIQTQQSIAIPINDLSFSSYSVLDVTAETSRGNTIQTQINT